MKTQFIIINLLTVLNFCCCEKDKNNTTGTGKIVFYTNAQAILNCGLFNVDIYINNDSIGTLRESYIEETQPTFKRTSTTLMIEKKAGKYSYSAKLDCGQYGNWSG